MVSRNQLLFLSRLLLSLLQWLYRLPVIIKCGRMEMTKGIEVCISNSHPEEGWLLHRSQFHCLAYFWMWLGLTCSYKTQHRSNIEHKTTKNNYSSKTMKGKRFPTETTIKLSFEIYKINKSQAKILEFRIPLANKNHIILHKKKPHNLENKLYKSRIFCLPF